MTDDSEKITTKFEFEMHRFRKGRNLKPEFALDQLRGVTPGTATIVKDQEPRDESFVERMKENQKGCAELPDARVMEKW